jgi:outer membrane lipoprotein-sorting protein
MKTLRFILLGVCLALARPQLAPAQGTNTNSPALTLAGVVTRLAFLVEPTEGQAARTFTATLKVVKAEGLPSELAGRELEVAYQAPDHLRLSALWNHLSLTLCRDGQQVWVYAPEKKFGVVGSPDVAPFAAAPEKKDTTPLGPMRLPFPREQVILLPLLLDVEGLPDEECGGARCRVVKAAPKPEATSGLNVPQGTLRVWVRESDSLPLRLAWRDAKGAEAQVDILHPQFSDPWPAEKWKLQPGAGDKVETVARSHLTRFLAVAMGMLTEKAPVLGPPTGERRVMAREGAGRLEVIDGTRVLFVKGTPEEMGRQQGVLLRKEARALVNHILYGVGVGSSFEKGRWFISEIEAAEKRLTPFMDERYLREMDALADAAGMSHEEARLGNFFPELFHCSGFALFGKATEGGRLYHGRILDYIRGLGLEQEAVVMVFEPDRGNAWVNIGYAGFVGTVTAMNEKQLAIGEMGGRGQGNWDGKPMAQLLREVMEKANTLEEGLEILRKGPRTCEYFYVLSDAKTKRAVGIAATPDRFETIQPGESHPLLPHPFADTVLMSAGDRYEELARRVGAGYGKFNAESARALMRRPVCMTSNIHCALFAPDTLDFWVANADSEHVAAHARFTHYNLAELLQPERAQ